MPSEISIVSIDGRNRVECSVTTREATEGKEVDVSTMSKGTYFCEAIHPQYGIISTKFIVQ